MGIQGVGRDTHMIQACCDLGMLLLVGLSGLPFVLREVGQLIADDLQLLRVELELFGLVVQFIHVGSPGFGDQAACKGIEG